MHGAAALALLPLLCQAVASAASEAEEQEDGALIQTGPPPAAQRRFLLHRMESKGLDSEYGAVCLDGNPAAFYMAPSTKKHARRSWVIHLEGGGWCTSAFACFRDRANVTEAFKSLGSLVNLPDIGPEWIKDSLMNTNCSVNPHFCDFNLVYVPYCDGTSFSGDLEEPVPVPASEGGEIGRVYFRGKRIFRAVVDTLLQELGMSEARQVLFTGCSAGGLAALLLADELHERLLEAAPDLKKFGVAPVSGFFSTRPTIQGNPIFTAQMQNLFALSNWTSASRKCKERHGLEAWRCNHAKFAYEFVEAPIFLLNSALDQFQTACIRLPERWQNFDCPAIPGWEGCYKNITNCTQEQLPVMNRIMDEFVEDVTWAATFRKAGNGAFIDGCHYHCEGHQNVPFDTFKVGGVAMNQAVLNWWRSGFKSPAARHTQLEHCRYGFAAQCNPTCVQGGIR